MSISQIARSISQSATLKLNETAAILRAKGEPGGGGECDRGDVGVGAARGGGGVDDVLQPVRHDRDERGRR